MRAIAFIATLALLLAACKQGNVDDKPVSPLSTVTDSSGAEIVAEDIIYDVVIKTPDTEDPWEIEKLKGYQGDNMINRFFEAAYNGEAEIYEYFSGKNMSVRDLKKLEETEGFQRENIGKIQFTERWLFDPVTLQVTKEVKSVVIGYENRDPADGTLIGYNAAFRIDLK